MVIIDRMFFNGCWNFNIDGISVIPDYLYYLATGSDTVFSERTTLRSLYAISRPSVVCRLSVTLVHPTQAVELFGNFFHHTIA